MYTHAMIDPSHGVAGTSLKAHVDFHRAQAWQHHAAASAAARRGDHAAYLFHAHHAAVHTSHGQSFERQIAATAPRRKAHKAVAMSAVRNVSGSVGRGHNPALQMPAVGSHASGWAAWRARHGR